MRKSTTNGNLTPINKCYISIPGGEKIVMNNLPDISDSKSANYNTQGIPGRSAPLYTYSYSGDRTISMQIHFFIVEQGDGAKNLGYLRLIQSAVYPREGTPFTPPPICQIRCGDLLAKYNNSPICAVLQNYSVKFPTDVAWESETFCPFRFDVDTSWLVVYTSEDLPNQDRIISTGR